METGNISPPDTPNPTKVVIIPDNPAIPLDEHQAAKLIGCSIHKLRRDRWAGGGIPFLKLGDGKFAQVRYRRADIDAYLISRVRRSTSDPGPVAKAA